MNSPSDLSLHLEVLLDTVQDFAELSEQCFGAWPPTVVDALKGLTSSGHPLSGRARELAESARHFTVPRTLPQSELPVEHPLDFDWRFSDETCRELLRTLAYGLEPGEKILLVCAPALALYATKMGFGSSIVVGTRSWDCVIERLRSYAPELEYVDLDRLEGVQASALLIDPPWYDDIALPLVSKALSGLRLGARVLLCGPDVLTFASAATALLGENDYMSRLGLVRKEADTRIRYKTPLFEMRSLASLGLGNVSPLWRTGIVRQYLKSCEGEKLVSPLPGSDWRELKGEPVRAWVRLVSEKGMLGNEQIVVSTSVSRTNPLQTSACLWTSNNTVVTGARVADLQEMLSSEDWKETALGKRVVSAEESLC